MGNDESQHLTTGEVAKLCSVKADTVLKWIKKGRLAATRTAGGHHRVDRRDLAALMDSNGSVHPVNEACARASLRCWEYLSEGGVVRDACKQCAAYRARAAWCFELMKFCTAGAHANQFCSSSCGECVYFQRVKGGVAKVLLVSSDRELIGRLNEECGEDLSLRFARNGYDASALVESFQPAFVIVDHELLGDACADLVSCLARDPRVPGLKVMVAVSRGFEDAAGHPGVTCVLTKPFGAEAIKAAIGTLHVEAYEPASEGTGSPQE